MRKFKTFQLFLHFCCFILFFCRFFSAKSWKESFRARLARRACTTSAEWTSTKAWKSLKYAQYCSYPFLVRYNWHYLKHPFSLESFTIIIRWFTSIPQRLLNNKIQLLVASGKLSLIRVTGVFTYTRKWNWNRKVDESDQTLFVLKWKHPQKFVGTDQFNHLKTVFSPFWIWMQLR